MISAASASTRYAPKTWRPAVAAIPIPDRAIRAVADTGATRVMKRAVNAVTGNQAVGIAVPDQPRYRLFHNQHEKVLSKARCAIGRTSPALRSR
jgi:hypothetical protein